MASPLRLRVHVHVHVRVRVHVHMHMHILTLHYIRVAHLDRVVPSASLHAKACAGHLAARARCLLGLRAAARVAAAHAVRPLAPAAREALDHDIVHGLVGPQHALREQPVEERARLCDAVELAPRVHHAAR